MALSSRENEKNCEVNFIIIGSENIYISQLVATFMDGADNAQPKTFFGKSTYPNYIVGNKKINVNIREVNIVPNIGNKISYIGLDAIILLFSFADLKSFENIKPYEIQARLCCDRPLPIVLTGIANNEENNLNQTINSQLLFIENWAKTKDIPFCSINTLDKADVKKLFEKIVSAAVNKEQICFENNEKTTLHLDKENNNFLNKSYSSPPITEKSSIAKQKETGKSVFFDSSNQTLIENKRKGLETYINWVIQIPDTIKRDQEIEYLKTSLEKRKNELNLTVTSKSSLMRPK